MRNKPLIPLTKDSSGRVGSGVYKDFDLTISIFNKSKPLTKMGGGGMGGNKIKVINSISWLKFSEMNKLKMFFMFIKIFYVRNISHVFLKTYWIMTVKTEKRVNKWNSKKRVKKNIELSFKNFTFICDDEIKGLPREDSSWLSIWYGSNLARIRRSRGKSSFSSSQPIYVLDRIL